MFWQVPVGRKDELPMAFCRTPTTNMKVSTLATYLIRNHCICVSAHIYTYLPTICIVSDSTDRILCNIPTYDQFGNRYEMSSRVENQYAITRLWSSPGLGSQLQGCSLSWLNCRSPGWQKLASFRQAQKMPSILSSDAYLLIRDKKRCFFAYYQNCNKKVVFT